jgi:hypothetical protein
VSYHPSAGSSECDLGEIERHDTYCGAFAAEGVAAGHISATCLVRVDRRSLGDFAF